MNALSERGGVEFCFYQNGCFRNYEETGQGKTLYIVSLRQREFGGIMATLIFCKEMGVLYEYSLSEGSRML